MYKKFSVLMSLYDKENPYFLDECFNSLSNQTILADEIVLVLDGPINKQLYSIVNKWKKILPLVLVVLEQNKGLSTALNAGLEKCSHDLVARMDTDDICDPIRFEKQVNCFNSLNIDVCGTWAIDIDNVGYHIRSRHVPVKMNDIKKYIWSCPIIHPSVMFRRKVIMDAGSYNPSAPYRQDDYELWIRCINHGVLFYNIPEYLLYYRFPLGSESKNTFKVGYNRFILGIKPALKYNPGFLSFFGLLYPMIRSVLPDYLQKLIIKVGGYFDPRRNKTD